MSVICLRLFFVGTIIGCYVSVLFFKNAFKLVKKILDLIIEPNSRKKNEFSQTLNTLARTLENSCSSVKISENEDGSTINVLLEWDSVDQKCGRLRVEAFKILSGATAALCDKVVIRLNGKLVNQDILTLNSL